jgi:general secretion pathway protein E
VFTTVHANNVFDVVGRFEQFGIDAYQFASAINGVMAQRLIRRVCPQCSVPVTRIIETDGGETLRRRAGPGCEQCRGTGYAGRFAIGEMLELDGELRDLVARRAPGLEIREAAASRQGWRSLGDQAMDAVDQGWTTAEEADRVAD